MTNYRLHTMVTMNIPRSLMVGIFWGHPVHMNYTSYTVHTYYTRYTYYRGLLIALGFLFPPPPPPPEKGKQFKQIQEWDS